MANSSLINIDTPVSVIDASVFKMGPDQVLYKNEEVATVKELAPLVTGLKNLLDSYIKLQVRVADPDLLPDVGEMAYNYGVITGSDDYIYSACKDTTELFAAGFDPGPEGVVDNTCNLVSLKTLESLTGGDVFGDLNSWTADLPALESCNTYFSRGPLTTFISQMPNLKSGKYMFSVGLEFTSWENNISSLENGIEMFARNVKLNHFASTLQHLVNGNGMFSGCTSLGDYEGSLASLLEGKDMFISCVLTKQSVSNIAAGINYVADLSWETIDEDVKTKYELTQDGFKRLDLGMPAAVVSQITTEANIIVSRGWDLYINGTKYEPVPPNA